ncbi:hypothetical protein HOLleu_26778 [Holothuria leucospilota]|uniref:Endonuclease/exonuclease/phosphatase domain-containing protein n=1 Tax=Holothuria leucospilota TaxID=206669 RepID=A0A9Q1H0B2_HOLLE|nr:hypothetical protein HOLleu_26778 [Holothuria leucospilota]
MLSNEGFNVFHMNSRSLNKNFNSIVDYLSIIKHNFAVIAFSETWLNNNVSPLININNYSLIDHHRTHRKGGGICLFVRRDFTYSERVDLSFFNDNVESLFVEMTAPYCNVNVIVGVIYRPPNGDISQFNDYLYDTLYKISRENKYCYILGDFYIDTFSEDSSNFLHTLYTCGFSPVITKPTRVSNSSATLIDNILSNVSFIDDTSHELRAGGLVTDISDHFPIFLNTSFKCKKSVKRRDVYIQKFSEDNIRMFVLRISAINWEHVLSKNDTNTAFDTFYDMFRDIHDACFPMIRIKGKGKGEKSSPWITSGIISSIKKKKIDFTNNF